MHFYVGIFGWEFEDTAPSGGTGRYVIATLDGQDAGAIMGPGTGTAAWNTYVWVEDAVVAARHLLSVGATLLPGGWNFSDLHTTDTEAAVAFYTKALDWQFDNLDFGTMIRRPGYGDHLEATVDPNIRVRQAGGPVPAASRTLSPGLPPRRPVSVRSGT